MKTGSYSVLCIQRVLTDYRAAFFEEAYRLLAERGVTFQVLCGQERPGESLRDMADRVSCAVETRNYYGGPVYWTRDALSLARQCDLLIIEQANAPLHNQLLMLRRRLLRRERPKLAFWGHGQDFLYGHMRLLQAVWKKYWTCRADWWFAYTDRTRAILLSLGYPAERITVMNNSTDTVALRHALDLTTRPQLLETAQRLFPADAPAAATVTAVFCSRLVEYKNIPFLLEAAEQIHAAVPDFRLIIIGAGPLAGLVHEFCTTRPWCVAVGAKIGAERAVYFRLARLWLVPGAIGLEATDALAAGLPPCTVESARHGPEIAYLQDGRNACISPPVAHAFATRVIDLIRHPDQLDRLRDQALLESANLGVHAMAQRFADGAWACLTRPSRDVP